MASEQSLDINNANTSVRRRPRKKTRVVPILAAVIVAGSLAGWWWSGAHRMADASNRRLTATVSRGDLVESVSATGSVTAQTGAEVKIGSQITGRIKRLFADVGAQVKATQVIAELDLPDIQAQLDQAVSNLAAARTKLAQTESGVGMERTQTSSAIAQSQAALNSSRAKVKAAQAAASLQTAQTPTDIQRAEATLAASRAALSTAKSNLAQTQAGANLQTANAQEQINQAVANARNSAVDLKRQQTLLEKGFVAASVVDVAQATATVNQSQVHAAQQNLELVKQKVTADMQAAGDQVTQAQQNVQAATAALASANAETNQDAARLADVQDSEAQVHQAEANLSTALANRTQDLLKMQDVQQAKEAVKTAEALVAYNRAQVDKTLIRSPISGTVLQLAAQQGETLAAGLAAPTLIVVADLNRLQVDVYVDETDIGKVKLGQSAEVTVDAFPKHIFEGKVTKIASGSTIQQGVITYDVTVTLANPEHRLKPDMTASVRIQTGKLTNVLLVPSEAVKLGTRGATVYVITTKDGKTTTEPRKVRTGGNDGSNTEIRSGLNEGDKVVLAGMDQDQRRPAAASPFGPGGGGGGGRGGR